VRRGRLASSIKTAYEWRDRELMEWCMNEADSLQAANRNPVPVPARPWAPQFDAISPRQEALALQFSIALCGGERPDAVRVLEMARALYEAEAMDAGQRPSSTPLAERVE